MTLTLYEGSPHDPITVSVASSTAGLSFNRSDLANTVTLTQTAAGILTCSGGMTFTGAVTFPANVYLNAGATHLISGNGSSANTIYSGGTSGLLFRNQADTTTIVSLTDSGSVVFIGSVTGSGAYVNSSDIRLKTNVATLTDALNKVEALRGVSFEWNNNSPLVKNEPQIGLIAQEVQEVLPEVVSPSVEGYLGVAYGSIVPVLVEAIKELSNKVKYLESKLENK